MTISPVFDAVSEGSETVVLELTSGSYNLGPISSAVVTIYDRPTITVTASSTPLPEENNAEGRFTFQRTGSLDNSLTVFFELPAGAGRAALGQDYQIDPDDNFTVTFQPGESSAVLKVLPVEDTRVEGSEAVYLNLLSDPINSSRYAIGSPGNATLTLQDKATITVPSDLAFSMTLLLDISGYDSYAYGISAGTSPTTAAQNSDHTNPLTGYYWNSIYSYGTLTFNGYHALPYGAGSPSAGVLVGGVNTTSSSFPYAFKWTSAGGFVQLNGLGGQQTIATDYALEDSGSEVIVGWSTIASGPGAGYNKAAFWRTSGSSFTMTSVGTLSPNFQTRYSYAYAVSKNGVIVGKSQTDSGAYHGFQTFPFSVIEPSTDDIGTMNSGSGSSAANDINDLDELAGAATVSSGQSHAFYKAPNMAANAGFTDLGVLSGATSSSANGINNSGHIVGTSGGKAVLWFNNGTMKDLSVFQTGVAGNVSNLNGWTLTTADKINNNGYIIGSGTKNGVIRAVILVPNKAY